MDNIPTICPNCGNNIRYVPAGISKRTGRSYGEFLSCSDRNCEFTWRKPREQQQKIDGGALLMDELQNGFKEVNERLDKLIAFVVDKLGKKDERFVVDELGKKDA